MTPAALIVRTLAIALMATLATCELAAGAPDAALDRQPALVDAAIQTVTAGVSGRTEVYFLGFAGDGKQGVFAKEVRFALSALSPRWGLKRRSIQLANSPDNDGRRPFATQMNLRRALTGLAARMNRDEDVLLLLLTSHGSRDAILTVQQGGLALKDVPAKDIKSVLDELGIRWRIIIVSACFSGSFINVLRDEHSLIATAARADRHSFGCADDRELTYYGEALFRDALPNSRSLREAIWQAQMLVAEKETAQRLVQSEPQLYVGRAMYSKLEEIPLR